MPTNKNKKQKISPSHRPVWRRKLFWFSLAGLLLILVPMTIMTIAQQRDKKALEAERVRFEQADKDVKAVADAVVRELGQPYELSKSQYCSRPSAKWEETLLSCKTGYDINYLARDHNQASDIYSKITESASRIFVIKSVTTSNNISEPKFQIIEPGFEQKIFEIYSSRTSDMECRITYRYFLSHFQGRLATSINCGSTARISHYAINNS